MMQKKVKIGKKEIGMRASARIPFEYREYFGGDLFEDMQSVMREREQAEGWTAQSCITISRLAWIMAKDAGSDVGFKEGEGGDRMLMRWLPGSKDYYHILLAAREIMDLWLQSNRSMAKPAKKARATIRKYTAAIYMLRCTQLHIGWDMLGHLSIGAVMDMLIEHGNDSEKYPYAATQEDINRFFG